MSDEKPGPTGRFPLGKLREDDQGELAIAVGVTKEGLVILEFNTPVAWTAMPASQARELATTILAYADRAEKIS